MKVLDFGLAKALDAPAGDGAVSQSPTLSLAATRAGILLGTAAYMAPEQARGKPADKRADIWAFGCILYEMLTGKRAFEGEDISLTLAEVMKERARLASAAAKRSDGYPFSVAAMSSEGIQNSGFAISVTLVSPWTAHSIPPAALTAAPGPGATRSGVGSCPG